MYAVLVVKLVVSVDSVVTTGFVLTVSVLLLFTGIVTTLVSTVVLVSVVGTVIIDDLDVTAVEVTGQVVVLQHSGVSASVGLVVN